MSDPFGGSPGFPVSEPEGIDWRSLRDMPVIGREADEEIAAIRSQDRRLWKELVRMINRLLDRPLSKIAEKISDPPGIGPRYLIDLKDGYVAVFWVVDPPANLSGSPRAVWIERVVLRTTLEAAFAAHALKQETSKPRSP